MIKSLNLTCKYKGTKISIEKYAIESPVLFFKYPNWGPWS